MLIARYVCVAEAYKYFSQFPQLMGRFGAKIDALATILVLQVSIGNGNRLPQKNRRFVCGLILKKKRKKKRPPMGL